MSNLDIQTPAWSIPLLAEGLRYRAGKGGRGSGKSHWFAERAVEDLVVDKDIPFLCVREIQKSIKYSAKRLIEMKIKKLGVSHLFEVQRDVIYRRGGDGLFLFQGMQDHTAESIKSLEGMRRTWVEEANSLSANSLKLLRPTIFREDDSEMWASWNPDQPDDPIELLLCGKEQPPGTALVHVNYDDNPFFPKNLRIEMEYDRKHNPDGFGHIWLGEHNKKTKAQIFAGKWIVDEFEPGADWNGPYFGLDFGFSSDALAGVKLWIHDDCLFIEYEAFKVGLELDDTAPFLKRNLPEVERHVIRADNARPESISYLKRHGIPQIIACVKGKGSVEDGIEFIRSFRKIIIHRRCEEMQREARMYSYKVDSKTQDILPVIVDQFNHGWDATRYGLEPMIKDNDRMALFKAMAQ